MKAGEFLDFVLYEYAFDCLTILYDPTGSYVKDGSGGSNMEYIHHQAGSTGYYVVEIFSQNREGDYKGRLAIRSTVLDDFDLGHDASDNFTSAEQITDGFYFGSIHVTSSDIYDYLSIYLESGSYIAVYSTCSGYNTDLLFYDNLQEEVAREQGSISLLLGYWVNTTGNHYLGIKLYSGYANYAIYIRITEPINSSTTTTNIETETTTVEATTTTTTTSAVIETTESMVFIVLCTILSIVVTRRIFPKRR